MSCADLLGDLNGLPVGCLLRLCPQFQSLLFKIAKDVPPEDVNFSGHEALLERLHYGRHVFLLALHETQVVLINMATFIPHKLPECCGLHLFLLESRC